jgi:hypothetical protein
MGHDGEGGEGRGEEEEGEGREWTNEQEREEEEGSESKKSEKMTTLTRNSDSLLGHASLDHRLSTSGEEEGPSLKGE